MARRKKAELSLVGPLILSFIASSMAAHNITAILEEFPDFTILNDLLTETKVDDEINALESFTLLAPSNAAMTAFRSANPEIQGDKVADLLRYHVLLRYVTVGDLQDVGNGNLTEESTLFTTSGKTTGKDGDVTIFITSSKILIGSSSSSSTKSAVVNTVFQHPFDISIVLIDKTLEPPGFQTVPISGANITDVLEGLGGYTIFASFLKQTGVDKIFEARKTGITIFVPTDEAFDAVPAEWFEDFGIQQQRLLMQYHALTKFSSLGVLWRYSDSLVSTIATTTKDPESYSLLITADDGVVTIFSSTPNKPNATVRSTLYDASPFVMYSIDAVLLPVELFGDVPAVPITVPTPAPDFVSLSFFAPEPAFAPIVRRTVTEPTAAFTPAASSHVAPIDRALRLALLSAVIQWFHLRA